MFDLLKEIKDFVNKIWENYLKLLEVITHKNLLKTLAGRPTRYHHNFDDCSLKN